MQTQHHSRAKAAFHPSLAVSKPSPAKPAAQARTQARPPAPRFRIVKPYPGFHLNQVVHQFTGPTYGIDAPGEIPVTVTPGVGPFIGLTPDYLERIA
jgi:hypothetical protein